MFNKLQNNKKLLAAVICGVTVIGYWMTKNGESASADVSYQTAALTRGDIESIVNTAGTLNPVVTVEVGTEVSGLVSELNADFNSEVKSGDVIARIDDRTIQARLRQSEADLASSKASLEQTKANMAKAEADLVLASSDLKRQQELRDRQLNSQVDLDQAIAAAENAKANLAVSKAQIVSAEANILQSQAQLEQSQLDLERTVIRSPVDGTVIDRQVDIGQTVAASLSAPTLFQIAQDLTKMQIEADVDEADIGKISEGQLARFTVDAYPDATFDGEITQVRKASTITSNVVTYKVIITADNRRQQLLPGMTANVNIILGIQNDALRVTNGALRFNPPEGVVTASSQANRENAELASALEQMDLSDTDTKKVLTIASEMSAAIQEIRESSQEGGFDRNALTSIRDKMASQLEVFLDTEQLATVQSAMRGGGRGQGGGRTQGRGDGYSPGQVWILDDGTPRAISLRTGLSDDQYTEVVTNDLSEGDEVIVRVSRTTQ